MYLSAEITNNETKAATAEQLQNLLHEEFPIQSLVLEEEAVQDLTSATYLIKKHSNTLRSITLNGENIKASHVNVPKIPGLANALKKCIHLTALHIVNFQAIFKDDVSYLATTLFFLPKLITLSFKNTILANHISLLSKDLAISKSLKTVDLTNAILSTPTVWKELGEDLAKSGSLEQLILGNTPICFYAVQYLYQVISMQNSTIKVITWHPDKFEDNERHSIAHARLCNWNSRLWLVDQIHEQEAELKDYLLSGESPTSKTYHTACNGLRSLQNFLKNNRTTNRMSSLIVELDESDYFSVELARTKIAHNSDTLLSLIINCCSDTDRKNPIPFEMQINLLLSTLRACKVLHTLKLVNFKGRLKNSIAHSIKLISCVSSLRQLAFQSTYIGKYGVEALGEVLSRIELTELDLTHSGLIDDQSFERLAESLKSHKTLEKVMLGNSPMRASWLEAIAMVIKNNNIVVEWQVSSAAQMSADLSKMIGALSGDSSVPRSTISEEEIKGIITQWNKLLEIMYPKPRSGAIYKKSYSQEDEGFEIEMASYKSPLLQSGNSQRYGSVSVRRSEDEEKPTGNSLTRRG